MEAIFRLPSAGMTENAGRAGYASSPKRADPIDSPIPGARPRPPANGRGSRAAGPEAALDRFRPRRHH